MKTAFPLPSFMPGSTVWFTLGDPSCAGKVREVCGAIVESVQVERGGKTTYQLTGHDGVFTHDQLCPFMLDTFNRANS